MRDIVSRLRDAVHRSECWSDDYHQSPCLWGVAREAADYIERLTFVIPELIQSAKDNLERVEDEWGRGWGFDKLLAAGDAEAVIIQSVIDALGRDADT